MPATRKPEEPTPDPDPRDSRAPSTPGATGQGREVRKEPAPPANPEAQGLTSPLPKRPPDESEKQRRTKSTRPTQSFKRPD